jgi:hypothetical protein
MIRQTIAFYGVFHSFLSIFPCFVGYDCSSLPIQWHFIMLCCRLYCFFSLSKQTFQMIAQKQGKNM